MLSPVQYVNHSLKNLHCYLTGVTNSTLTVGRYERLAVDRFNSFKSKYQYRESELIRVIKFFSLLNISNNNKTEQIQLLQHQIFWLANFYGLWNNNNRLFNTAYIETAKKSGKSSFSACLSIYEAIGNNVLNSHALILAASREQARTNLTFCQSIIENSPLIEPYFQINKNIIYNKTEKALNKIEIRASEATKLHGIGNGMSLSIIDEYAFHKNSDLKNAVKTAQIVMPSHLQLIFTTASNNLQSPAYSLRETCVNILEGKVQDDSIFSQIFTLDDNTEQSGSTYWRKSNPSLGHIITIDQMQKEYDSAKVFPDKLNSFLIFNLNLWIQNLTTTWIEDEVIKNLMVDNKQIPFSTTASTTSVFASLDLAANSDLCSIGILWYNEIEKEFIAKTINIFPHNGKKKIREGSIDLSKWFKKDGSDLLSTGPEEGYIVLGKGKVLDEDLIIEIVRRINQQYHIISLGADPWNSYLVLDKIERELNIITNQVKQNITTLNFPLRLFETAILQEKIFFDQSPVLRWMFSNVQIYEDMNLNRKINKQHNEAVDGVVALLICFSEFLRLNGEYAAFEDLKKSWGIDQQ